ncbi:MAG TPA: serine hydrolase, partial [Candidatus Nanoarchaeia archaeon]|nr:serine hydrolase [Candidatus Nanoarchaeia archaeon]
LPASLNKLVLAILIMKKVEEGKLSLDSELKISESDRLSSSGELYRTTDDEIPLNIVIEKLLSESDNTAFSILLHYVTEEDIEFILDYYNLDISLDFEGGESRKHSNTISPKSMSNLFLSLYFSTVLEAKNSEYLLSLMKDNVFDINQIAGLPEGVEVAHKFGEHYLNSTKIFHDCGIMYAAESRIFYCIMSKDMEKEDSVENAAFITRSIYEYVNAVKVKYGTK